MRRIQYVRAGCLASTLVAFILMAGSARADVSTERPGSLLIFPKVVQAGGRETIIQVTNTGNSVDNLHCFYINGQNGPNGHPLCAVTDFFVSLTKQQPTHWDISTGRPVNPSDQIAGFDPGLIPPVAPGFTGALVCSEVDADGAPVAMNKLKGEATLEGPNGDVSKYNGLAVQGKTSPPVCSAGTKKGNACVSDGDCPGARCAANLLMLDNTNYNACSTASVLNFIPDGAVDPVIEALGDGGTCSAGSRVGLGCNSNTDCPLLAGGSATCNTGQSRVINTITALPCNLDLQTQVPTQVTLQYLVIDGDEGTGSYSSPLSCWASINLEDIPPARSTALGGPFASMRITSTSGGPVLLVGESFHVDADGNLAAAAVNLHTTGLCQKPGTQAPDISQTCLTSADCPATWTCISTQSSTIKLPTLFP